MVATVKMESSFIGSCTVSQLYMIENVFSTCDLGTYMHVGMCFTVHI